MAISPGYWYSITEGIKTWDSILNIGFSAILFFQLKLSKRGGGVGGGRRNINFNTLSLLDYFCLIEIALFDFAPLEMRLDNYAEF